MMIYPRQLYRMDGDKNDIVEVYRDDEVSIKITDPKTFFGGTKIPEEIRIYWYDFGKERIKR
jgi:hypothetical protein